METTVEQLLAEAQQMALELRIKDKLITALQARIAGAQLDAAPAEGTGEGTP